MVTNWTLKLMMMLQTVQLHLLANTQFGIVVLLFFFVVDQLLFGVRVRVMGIVDADMFVLVILIVGRRQSRLMMVDVMMAGVWMMAWVGRRVYARATKLDGTRLVVCGWRRWRWRWRRPKVWITFVNGWRAGWTPALRLRTYGSDTMVSIGNEHLVRRQRRDTSVAMDEQRFSGRCAGNISRLWSSDKMWIHLLYDHHFERGVF